MISGFQRVVSSAVAVTLASVTSGVISGTVHAQGGVVANGQNVAGISCDAQEGQRLHIHQHLVILDHGKSVPIPQDVGQVPAKRCLYWLHTHTPDGIVHIEAPLDRKFTLGDFFAIWGQPLNRTHAATAVATKAAPMTVWLNGKKYSGDPRKIAMIAHADIVIQVGPPYAKPAAFTTWGTL